MRILGVAFAGMLVCTVTTSGTTLAADTGAPPQVWTFDTDLPGALPQDFAIGTLFDGRPAGEWNVPQTDRAKSPSHVLGQLMRKGAEYKTVLINGISASETDLRVSFLANQGVTRSMSRAGNVWDNAVMESFSSSLKTERTAAKTYRTRTRADVSDYVERFYNSTQRHSTLGYLSPMEVERKAGLA